MDCVFNVVQLLVAAEEGLPQDSKIGRNFAEISAKQPIPIMKIFLPWLIEGCIYDE
jgi:hypothetical protein